jgi:hypothetical protein
MPLCAEAGLSTQESLADVFNVLKVQDLLKTTGTLVAIVYHTEKLVQLPDIVDGRIFRNRKNFRCSPVDLEDTMVHRR